MIGMVNDLLEYSRTQLCDDIQKADKTTAEDCPRKNWWYSDDRELQQTELRRDSQTVDSLHMYRITQVVPTPDTIKKARRQSSH
ncbi:MAG: hypothetical protein JWR21_3267 [Herminiimonas sp.]|nr:hypothetical protein [Herminiimonas sp.]